MTECWGQRKWLWPEDGDGYLSSGADHFFIQAGHWQRLADGQFQIGCMLNDQVEAAGKRERIAVSDGIG